MVSLLRGIRETKQKVMEKLKISKYRSEAYSKSEGGGGVKTEEVKTQGNMVMTNKWHGGERTRRDHNNNERKLINFFK